MEKVDDNVRAKVIEIIRASVPKQFDAGALDNVNLIEDLGMDSVQVLDLLMTVEETFGIAFDEPDVDLDSLMRIGALVEFIARRHVPQAEPAATRA